MNIYDIDTHNDDYVVLLVPRHIAEELVKYTDCYAPILHTLATLANEQLTGLANYHGDQP